MPGLLIECFGGRVKGDISANDILAAMLREQGRMAVRRGEGGPVVLIYTNCSHCVDELNCSDKKKLTELGCGDFRSKEV